jgi:glycerol-3-phosphate dehydrogenase
MLNRDLAALADTSFDMLVIGGGVLGACVVRDAALRGIRVALVEKGDFAAGTSWNCLKIVHGGIRHLQQLDVRQMRASMLERSTWLRIAPHLVEPLPVVVPTYSQGLQRQSLLLAALAVNDLLSFDRNRGLQPTQCLLRGRSVSRRECVELVPELDSDSLSGGVLFHDGLMYSSERLVLSVLRSAAQAGACVANYVEFEDPLIRKGRLAGARLKDVIGGGRLDIKSKAVVNAAGPAAPLVAERLAGRTDIGPRAHSIALNIVVRGFGHKVACAVVGSAKSPMAKLTVGMRRLFVVPWRGHSLIGTGHYPYHGDTRQPELDGSYVARFLDEVNHAWPHRLTSDDVQVVHSGLLPLKGGSRGNAVRLLGRHKIVDHSAHGVPGAISAISVKFSGARLLAEQVVDTACRRAGLRVRSCLTSVTPLSDAPAVPVDELVHTAKRRFGQMVESDVVEHIVRVYGTGYEKVLARCQVDPGLNQRVEAAAPVLRAQFVHGVREEMALLPEDLFGRRTELGARGLATEAVIRVASEALAAEQHHQR